MVNFIRKQEASFAVSWPVPRRFCQGLDLGAFQGKSNLGLDAEMALKACFSF